VTLFSVAVAIGFLMRLEQLWMGGKLFGPSVYNAMFTLHGVIMLFMFVIPGLPATFGNFLLPIMIGARDVAFPRLNLASWYFFMAGVLLLFVALFTGSGPPDTGWTFYVPYSLRSGTNVPLAVLAVFLVGMSTIFTGLNFLTTIHRMRAPGLSWFRLPVFVWTLYATGWIQVIATPVIGITMLLIVVERVFGVGVFDPTKGGDPLLYQHLFWMYSHPAVYVMILPGMGAVSEIIPTFARRTIFGYRAVVYSAVGIAALGSLVWAHHMFTSGMSDAANVIFSLLTFLVAVPSAIKVFNWTATLYKGSITLEAPMLFALAFLFLFSIGGLTGIIQGALAVNVHLHDTYFIVGHIHFVVFGGTGFAFFGALLYWFPKMFGRMYSQRAAIWAWALMFVGFNVLYFTMLILGYMGMPRRYYDHLPQFHAAHVIATVGSWPLVAGIVLLFATLAWALRHGAPAQANPWGGVTLEWQVPSPPPTEDFETLPTIDRPTYAYDQGSPT
jgi:cytochrome c oxidase subunit 1